MLYSLARLSAKVLASRYQLKPARMSPCEANLKTPVIHCTPLCVELISLDADSLAFDVFMFENLVEFFKRKVEKIAR